MLGSMDTEIYIKYFLVAHKLHKLVHLGGGGDT